MSSQGFLCTLGVFLALAFAADFPPVAPEFQRRTQRQRLRNLGTTDKKSSYKIRHRKIPREHFNVFPDILMLYIVSITFIDELSHVCWKMASIFGQFFAAKCKKM